MGRLNKKLSKRVTVKSKVSTGLSSSAAKALLTAKDVIAIPTDTSKSGAAPVESFSSLVAKSKSPKSILDSSANSANNIGTGSQQARNNKKRFKTVQREGKVVKLKKKEKMKLRTDSFVNKLKVLEKEKKERLDKKKREKVHFKFNVITNYIIYYGIIRWL